MADVAARGPRWPSAILHYLMQGGLFILVAAIGSALVTAWRLIIFEPGPDVTFELWRNLSFGLAIFLAVLGTPFALIALALASRLTRLGAPRRWLVVALELVAGLAYSFLIIGGPLTSYPPIYPLVHLLPWLIFGLVAQP